MELSVRSFYKEIKENGVLLLRVEGQFLDVKGNERASSFYRSTEKETMRAVAEFAKTEKEKYEAFTEPRDKFAYRPLCFSCTYDVRQIENQTVITRQTQIVKKGKTIASYQDQDVWIDGFCTTNKCKNENNNCQKRKSSHKVKNFLSKIAQKAFSRRRHGSQTLIRAKVRESLSCKSDLGSDRR